VRTNHPIIDYTSVIDDLTQLVDVRDPDEVANGTLPGAINIPLHELADRLTELRPQQRVVVLCRSGMRSDRAAGMLADAGFADVVNLDGGMNVWEKANRKADRANNKRWSLSRLFG